MRREYFRAIAAGTKTAEIRAATPRWRTVASRAPAIAVFLCGREVHRREVVGTRLHPSARAALGRDPSAQGAADLGGGPVISFTIGREVGPLPPRPRDRRGGRRKGGA